MGNAIEKAWARFRIPLVLLLGALAVLMLASWFRTGSLRHGLLACALALYAVAFLSPGILRAVGEKRLLAFDAGPRNALLLGTALGIVAGLMAIAGR